MTTQTIEGLEATISRLEEQVLQLSVFNTYVADKNNFDMNAILALLFTVDKNVEIITANLVDAKDQVILARLVTKWKNSAAIAAATESRPAYKH